MPKTVELSQAMSARLCHDLAGSIGAIDSCIDLLGNHNKAIGKKAKELVLEESGNLVNRIKFFRSAYGLSSGETDMSIISMTKLLTDFFNNTDVKLKLSFEEGLIYLESQLAKAVICLVAIVSENISLNGHVNLNISKDQNSPVKLVGSGDNLQLKDEYIEVLKGEKKKPINVRNCREHYVNKLCAKKGYIVLVDKKSGSIEYKLVKKS